MTSTALNFESSQIQHSDDTVLVQTKQQKGFKSKLKAPSHLSDYEQVKGHLQLLKQKTKGLLKNEKHLSSAQANLKQQQKIYGGLKQSPRKSPKAEQKSGGAKRMNRDLLHVYDSNTVPAAEAMATADDGAMSMQAEPVIHFRNALEEARQESAEQKAPTQREPPQPAVPRRPPRGQEDTARNRDLVKRMNADRRQREKKKAEQVRKLEEKYREDMLVKEQELAVKE